MSRFFPGPARLEPVPTRMPGPAGAPPLPEPALRQPAAPAETSNPALRLGLLAICLYTVAFTSYNNEITIQTLGFKPHITTIAGPLAAVCALAGGQITRLARTGAGVAWLAFGAWLAASLPFSTWRGGSLLWLAVYSRAWVIALLVCALATTARQVRMLVYANAMGGMLVIFYCLTLGQVHSGRFGIPPGSLANPNDLALNLLMVVGFLLAFAFNRNHILRLAGWAGIALCAYFILLTASRGSICAGAAAVVSVGLAAPARRKLKALVVGLALAGALFLLSPQVTLERLALMFRSNIEEPLTDSEWQSVLSQRDRMELLRRSIGMTLSNPLFGVGPGQFAVQAEQQSVEAGVHVSNLNTHNTYTQISSDAGVPALAFLLAAVVLSIRLNVRRYRQDSKTADSSAAAVSMSLMVMSIGFAINIFFAHQGYTYQLPLVVGLSCANHLARPDSAPAHE